MGPWPDQDVRSGRHKARSYHAPKTKSIHSLTELINLYILSQNNFDIMVYSKDGFTWTPSAGRKEGLPSIGVVEPSTHSAQPQGDIHDVIVIGAGYAGLVASRDLATQGRLFGRRSVPRRHDHD